MPKVTITLICYIQILNEDFTTFDNNIIVKLLDHMILTKITQINYLLLLCLLCLWPPEHDPGHPGGQLFPQVYPA